LAQNYHEPNQRKLYSNDIKERKQPFCSELGRQCFGHRAFFARSDAAYLFCCANDYFMKSNPGFEIDFKKPNIEQQLLFF